LATLCHPRQRRIDADTPDAIYEIAIPISSGNGLPVDERIREPPAEIDSVVPVKPML
jgi:hypothetical protein